MTAETKNFVYNDKEYSFDEVSEKARYILGHVGELKTDEEKLKRDLDKISVTIQAFTQLLSAELEASPEGTEEESEEG